MYVELPRVLENTKGLLIEGQGEEQEKKATEIHMLLMSGKELDEESPMEELEGESLEKSKVDRERVRKSLEPPCGVLERKILGTRQLKRLEFEGLSKRVNVSCMSDTKRGPPCRNTASGPLDEGEVEISVCGTYRRMVEKYGDEINSIEDLEDFGFYFEKREEGAYGPSPREVRGVSNI